MNRNDGNETIRDDTLIRDFLHGEEGAFRKLIEAHMNMVFNLCYRIMGDYDDANDCAQETFVKIYRNIHSFKFKSSFATWAYRIAVNTCRNSLTSSHARFRKRAMSLDQSGISDRNPLDAPDRRWDPQESLDRDEGGREVRRAVNSLPADLRILVVLRDFEDKPYDEIAILCGMKLGTVKSKLARARRILRGLLQGVL